MEKFKINSQELIESSGGGNEDIFDAINSPDNHVFSLQRFADVSIGQHGGSTTMLSNNAFSGALYDWVLGRSNSSATARAGANSGFTASGTTIQYAPLVWSGSTVSNATYSITGYKVSSSETRLAIVADSLGAYSNSNLMGSTYGYWAGIAVNTGSSVFSIGNNLPTGYASATFTGNVFSNTTTYKDAYAKGADSYTALYFPLNGTNDYLGRTVSGVVTSGTAMTYSLDFYDVKLGSANPAVSGNATTGSYVIKLGTGQNILFASDTTLKFNDIQDTESETYKFNGVGFTIQGKAGVTSGTQVFQMTASTFASDSAQTFSSFNITSNANVLFTLTGLGSDTGVNLNSKLYKSSNDSGTVMFSASGTDKFITLGLGNFTLSDVGTETYNLANAATGTFVFGQNTTFTLDVDGTGTQYAPVSFVTGDNAATVTGIFNSSDIKLSGNFTSITGDTMTNLQFTFAESATANFSVLGFTFSDTADSTNAYIKFDSASAVTVYGTMSGTSSSNATYTLANSGTSFALGADVFSVRKPGTGEANKLFAINETLELGAAHSDTFAVSSLAVTGFSTGSNVSIADGFTIGSNTAKLLGGFYFYDSSASGTVTFNGSTGTTLTGFSQNLTVSAVSGTTLVGVSSHTFTAAAGTFFLKDGGSTTSINDFVFDEVSDSHVSKLVYESASAMGVFGSVVLTEEATGSNSMVYTLNGFTFSDTSYSSAIEIDGVKFEGSQTSVQHAGEGLFNLTASNTSVFSITGESSDFDGASSFTMSANVANAQFQFGASNTGILFTTASGTSAINNITAIFNDEGAFLASGTVTVGSNDNFGLLNIQDAANSSAYKVLLGTSGVLGISDIDDGASLKSVASATSVQVNTFASSGTYTFTTAVKPSGGSNSNTQVFQILGDADGVVFTLDSATGLVTQIDGIDAGATVNITDTYSASALKTKTYWSRSYAASGDGSNTWVMSATNTGKWGANAYFGYIVNSGTTLNVYGIASDTTMAHEVLDDYTDYVGSSTGSTFSLRNDVFSNKYSGTSVSFLSPNSAGYAATYSNTTIFTNLKTDNTYGILFSTDGEDNARLSVGVANIPNGNGTATTLSALPTNMASELSLVLGDYALGIYTGYNVSGTGVGVAISNTVTVSANGKSAYVAMPDSKNVNFGSSGTYLVEGLTTNTFVFGGTVSSGNYYGIGTNSSIFALDVLNGAIATSTFATTAATGVNGSSSLSINAVTYSLAGDSTSGTLIFAAAAEAGSTATFNAGTFTVDNVGDITDTGLGFAANAGLVFENYSYTGLANTSFMTLGTSDTMQIASVANGSIQADVAANSSFVFWLSSGTTVNSATFTANAGGVEFYLGGDATNTFVSGSATGVLNFEGQHSIAVLSETFVMQSGSSVILTLGDTYSSQSATTIYNSGSGTSNITANQTFALNEYYFSSATDRASLSTDIYNYVASGETVTLSLVFNNGTETVSVKSGVGTRQGITGSDTSFLFKNVSYSATTPTSLSFLINSATTLVKGALYAGIGTRQLTADAGTSTMLQGLSFQSNTYTTFLTDSLIQINVEAGQGTETFLSGSGTFVAQDGGSFYIYTSDTNNSYALRQYTATGVVNLSAGFSSSDTSQGVLYSAVGSGTRTVDSFDYTIDILSDTYKVTNGIMGVSFSSTDRATIANGYQEKFTSGTGVLYLNQSGGTGSQTTFALSDYYLGIDGASETAKPYVYTISNTGTLTLNWDVANNTHSITMSENFFATRSDTVSAEAGEMFTFTSTSPAFTANYTAASGTSLTYSINNSASSTGAIGSFYAGVGTRYNQDVTTATAMFGAFDFQSNTYAQFSGANIAINVEAGQGTETFLSGSGTFVAQDGGSFYIHTSDTNNSYALRPYTATGVVTLNAVFDNGSDSGKLYSAVGSGTRTVEDSFNYAIATLSDTYTITNGIMGVTFSETNVEGITGFAEDFTSGTGTLYLSKDATENSGSQTTFALSDYYLGVGTNSETESAKPYVYTISNTGTLTLNWDVANNTHKITMSDGFFATRSDTVREATGEMFTFTSTSPAFTANYTAASGTSLTYSIDNSASSTGAIGSFYAGVGTRYNQDVTTATAMFGAFDFQSNTYAQFSGANIAINVEAGQGTETFLSGSGTFVAQDGGSFYIYTSDTNNSYALRPYTATGVVTLNAVFDNGSDSGKLYSAVGSGTRTVEDSFNYAIATLSDTYTITNGIMGVTFSETNVEGITGFAEDFTSGTGVLYLNQSGGTGSQTTFALSDYYLGVAEASETAKPYVYTISNTGTLTLNWDVAAGTHNITMSENFFATRSDTVSAEAGEMFTFTSTSPAFTANYTAASGTSLTYSINNSASSTGAIGSFYAGVGTRSGVTATTDSVLFDAFKFQSNTYAQFSGANIAIKVEAGQGTETFLSGSATFKADVGDSFYFYASDTTGASYTLNQYTATGVVTLNAGFSSSDTSQGVLYSAVGSGTRTLSNFDFAIDILSDTYKIDNGIMGVSFSETNVNGITGYQEKFTSGTGTLYLSTAGTTDNGSQTTFALSDYYLGVGTNSETAKVYVYSISDTGELILNWDVAAGTHSITMSENFFATRSETAKEGSELPTFALGQQNYTAQVGNELTYAMNAAYASSTGAIGAIYAGDGIANDADGAFSGLTMLSPVTYESNTYTLFSGAMLGAHVVGAEGTETFLSGSATFKTETGNFYFKATSDTSGAEGTLQAYTATSAVELGAYFANATDTNGAVSYYHASGVGTREGSGTYLVSFLSDTYTMGAGSIITLTLSDTSVGGVLGTEKFTGGEGFMSQTTTGMTFHLADGYLSGTTLAEGATANVYEYTASGTANLTLSFVNGSETIALGTTFATRSDQSDTFFFNDETYSNTSGADLYYSIDANTASSTGAAGSFYAGAGTRFADNGSFSSLLNASITGLDFESNTYTLFSGANIGVNVEAGQGTETFLGGSATFVTTSESGGDNFYFKASGSSIIQAYTSTGIVKLGAYFSSSDTSTGELYHAEGAGTRIGDGTHTIGVLNSDTYQMNDAVITLTLSDTSVGFGTEEITSGTGKLYLSTAGTIDNGSQTTFALSNYYLGIDGADSTATVYNYTISDTGVLTLNLNGGSETIALSAGMVGLRETGTGVEFAFTPAGDDATSQTYTSFSNLTYTIDSTKAETSAEGALFAGIGTREFAEGGSTTATISFREDVYTPTEGTIKLTVENGTGSETFFGGTATFTANATGDVNTFHFSSDSKLLTGTLYSATSLVTLKVGVGEDGSATGLVYASGTGIRSITDEVFAVESLNNNPYSFTGTAQLTLESPSAFSETAYTGKGTLTPTDGMTVIAAFDSSSNITSTVYSYTKFSDATFTIGMDSGTLKTQSITGSATRENAEDATFQYVFNNNTYTYNSTSASGTSAGALTFVLNSDTAQFAGAQGGLTAGAGFRTSEAEQTGYSYTAIADVTYTLAVGTEWKLTVSDTATEDLFNASAVTNIAPSDTFTYLGTQYTAQSGTVMQLTAVNGDISEKLSAGSALFEGDSSDTTFTYDENEYRVSGTARLVLYANSETPVFESGHGIKEMSASATEEALKTFKYTDGNTYTVTSNYALLTADGNEGAAEVNFAEGSAIDQFTASQTFNFTLNGDSHTYTALTDNTALGISGTNLSGATPAVAKFIAGSATRLQDTDGVGQTFDFEGANYTSVSDTLTWTLSLSDTGNFNSANEIVTGADATRTLVGDTFTYLSPVANENKVFTAMADGIKLGLHLENNQGTETLLDGSATRNIDEGETFSLSPSNIYNIDSMTFTATSAGTYTLELKNNNSDQSSGDSGLLFMGYNIDVVTETFTGGAGTGTLSQDTTFGFNTVVTGKSNTYTAQTAIIFDVVADQTGNTATWKSGSGTMQLGASTEFYYTPTGGSANTYTVLESATFLRVAEGEEYLSAGTGYRTLATADSNFTATYLENTYTADVGAMIVLSSTGVTTTTEGFGSGTATFNSANNEGLFNFKLSNGDSHTYTASAGDVTLQLNVTDYLTNSPTLSLIGATGTGVRGLADGESYSTTVIGNTFTADSGTYTLDFASVADPNAVSETFTAGIATYDATGKTFNVNDYYLGLGSNSTTYTYDAITNTTLTLTIENGTYGQSSMTLSGAGTRTTDTGTVFGYTLDTTERSYTAEGDLTYAINDASATSAAGFLFNGIGFRYTTADEGGNTVFNSDTYTVGASATMQLTVTEAVGQEVMTQGTATYVATASSNDVFHFGDYAYNAYLSNTTLQIVFEGDSATNRLASISGQGTRAAGEDDVNLKLTYQSDTYHAIAGSSTILFNASGALDTTNTSLIDTAGYVLNEVSNTGIFHTNAAGEWYEYTAGSDVNITLSLSDSVQTFSNNPNALRTASDTTFLFNKLTYTATEGTKETYSLTGSGTNLGVADLTDKIFGAEGYRTDVANDSYTSTWNNTYALTAGTYSITVTAGEGEDSLTAGTGSATYAANVGIFNYGDSSTSFLANIEGATLTLTNTNGVDAEVLTAGAGFNGTETYIMASDAKVSLAGSTNATLGVIGADNVVTLTASELNTDTFVGGLTNISAGTGVSVGFGASGSIGINNKLFAAVTSANLVSTDLNVFKATTGTISAEGNFADAITLADKQVGISGDTDVAVFFDSSAITKLEKLTDKVTVSNAAGATKAITDSTGTFIFNSTAGALTPAEGNKQTFTINSDQEVTFQLDSATGLVTGIAGIDYAGTAFDIVIQDQAGEPETVSVSQGGIALTRDNDGHWATAEVVAKAYIITVDEDNNVTTQAIDSTGVSTNVENSRIGNVSQSGNNISISLSSSSSILSGDDPIKAYVVNKSANAVVNVTGSATISGIGYTSDTAAVQLTATGAQFVASTVNGADYGEDGTNYGVMNGRFSINADGQMEVAASNASSTVNVTMSADDTVGFVATETAASRFAVNDGTAVTLSIGEDDADGKGKFTAKLNGTDLTGLTPSGVETGTAVVATNAEGTTFAVADSDVTVTGDTDGMTLEIKDDKLIGLSDISTDATIDASAFAGTELAINGDEDNKVTASSEPIKYNTTKEQWITGNATSIEGATGYLVSLSADGSKVELYYTTSDTTVPKQTTNMADYQVVFDGTSPTEDGGELPDYSADGGVTIKEVLDGEVKVSIAAGNGGIAARSSDGIDELALVTANGNYTINDQQIIPSAAIIVDDENGAGVGATLDGSTTITHDAMQFTASTDTEAIFTTESISLGDTAKVTNTSNEPKFSIQGTVTFDEIVVKSDKTTGAEISGVAAVASLAANGSGLTIEEGKELNVVGGDLAYTVDVTSDTPVISGINGDATVNGSLVSEAQVQTASTGTFQVASSDPFVISNDSDVTFVTSNNSVVAINSLEGTAAGNFSNQVNIDSDHSVLILNDTLAGVTANGKQVTEIDGVGSTDNDVTIANAGGATLVTTDLNGGIFFGAPESAINSQHFNVTDEDAQVSFLTSSLTDYTPSVSGVQGLNNGSIAISQDERGFSIDGTNITLSGVSSDVTVSVAEDSITSVLGLEGAVRGLAAGVVVNAIDSDVTVNGATLQVVEGDNTNLTVYAAEGGFDTVTGLNKDASVTTAKNAHVVTEEEGTFTFIGNVSSLSPETYTISGDSSVTFETDGDSRVNNIADFAGTLKSTAYENTVNGAVVAVDTDAAITDVSIVSAGTGISSVLGLADGDSVTVPNDTSVQMPGTSANDTDTVITINGKTYKLEGDTDGVAIKAGADADTVTGLAPNASLTVGAAGTYNVNSETLTAKIGDVIIGDAEGSAHVYDPNDINIDTDTSTDDIIKNVTKADELDKYVENLSTDETAQLANEIANGDLSNANGNIQMAATNTDTTVQALDFANTTGIKKVTLESGAQDVSFNNDGGNIAIVDENSEGEKNIKLGDGGDLAIVNSKGSSPVNITAGRGQDTVVTKGRHVSMNLNAGGSTRMMPTAGALELEGYDHTTGAGIQLTNSNVALSVKTNSIKLQNGAVTVNGGAAVVTDPNATSEGSSIVNFYNLKGLMTKVGYTHDEGGMVDLRTSSGDAVLKGNYTEGSAQRKSGGSTLVSGSGNDTAFGGAGDAFDLGSGDNTLELDSDRTLSEAGARISQSAVVGRTEVNNFHADYSDSGDRVRIDTSKATVKFINGALRFVLGAATLILNAVSSSPDSADLASSADGETASKIGTVSSQKVLVEDSNDETNTAIRIESASENDVIEVERVDEVITQSYMGENSGVSFAKFDESAMVNLNQGEGMLGGEYVQFGGITKLQGGSTTNTLIGSGATNNTIVAGIGGGSIWGGGASNDTLSGVGSSLESLKATSNTFFFMNGDGKDAITDFTFLKEDNVDTADKINVHTAAVTQVDTTSEGDVIISLTNEDDKLTLKKAVGQDFIFDYVDGSGITQELTAQINTNSLDFNGRASYYQATGKNVGVTANSELSSADIWLNNDTNFSRNTFVGDIKYLNASNVEGKASLVGNGNDNIITASQGDSSMWGGDQGGNDTLVGGEGADMFWYGKNEGNGHDIVTNIDGDDVVNLYDANLEDILSADVTSNEVVITMKDSRNTLTVQGNVTSGISFKLANGTTYAIDSNRNWYQKN